MMKFINLLRCKKKLTIIELFWSFSSQIPGCPSLSPDSIPSPTHTFSCDQQHYLDGPETLNCKANGEWEREPPQCLPHTCDTWPCLDTEYCLGIESELGVPTCYTSCEPYKLLKNGRFGQTKHTMTFVCNEYYIIKGNAHCCISWWLAAIVLI